MYRSTNLDEKLEPGCNIQQVAVAVFVDRRSFDVFGYKI
jgi:hypothetical protein